MSEENEGSSRRTWSGADGQDESSERRVTLKDIGVLLVVPAIGGLIFLAVWGAQNGPRPDAVDCTVLSAEEDRGRRGGIHVDVRSSCGEFNTSLEPSDFVPGERYDFRVRGWINPIIYELVPR